MIREGLKDPIFQRFPTNLTEQRPGATNVYGGDQILDVNGVDLAGRSVAEISEIIRACPEIVVCTVKPVTDFRVVDARGQDDKRADYAELDLSSLKPRLDESSSGSEESISDSSHAKDSEYIGNEIEKKTEVQSFEEPKYDEVVTKNSQRRHSLPSHPKTSQESGRDLQYVELGFGSDYDRPRLKSDTPTKPKVEEHYKKPTAPIQAYAYIELDFNADKEPHFLDNS